MMHKALQELEVKITFLEDAVAKMSDEQYRQRLELDTLKSKYALLIKRVEGVTEGEDASVLITDEKPPHY